MQIMCATGGKCTATDVNVFQRLGLLWLCLLSVAITPYFSYHIECNQSYQTGHCASQTLACPPNDADDTDCSVACSAIHSCASATIDCSHSSSCDVSCTQYDACEALTLLCPPNATCNLRCVGDESAYPQRCEGVKVTASTASLVNVTCIGSHVCPGLAVDCGESQQCNVRCHGAGACDGTLFPTEIDGSHATQLRLLGCDGETSLETPACNSMTIRCPSYDALSRSPQCFIPGDGSYAVYGRDQSGGPLTVVSGGIDIYARHSWQDIMITHDESNDEMFPIAGTMYCQDDRYSCDIVTQVDGQWDCRDASLLCSRDQYTTDPTMEATFVPSMLPTLDPTVDPTQTPTSDPTVSPTADPTSEPTSPTQTPTKDPTSEPTVPVYGRFGLPIGNSERAAICLAKPLSLFVVMFVNFY